VRSPPTPSRSRRRTHGQLQQLADPASRVIGRLDRQLEAARKSTINSRRPVHLAVSSSVVTTRCARPFSLAGFHSPGRVGQTEKRTHACSVRFQPEMSAFNYLSGTHAARDGEMGSVTGTIRRRSFGLRRDGELGFFSPTPRQRGQLVGRMPLVALVPRDVPNYPEDPPEKRPSVMRAAHSSRPRPTSAAVGESISGIPRPPFGPS
jgi:hypothetical protein